MAFVGELRPFQAQARDQILEWGRGLLALTLGSGKTPTSIAITEELLDAGDTGLVMVITPASLKHQWNGSRGLPLFAPDANVVVIDGDPDQRREQYAKAQHWADYVILGYTQVVDDWDQVKRLPADAFILDEIQAIKSPGAQRSEKVGKLLRGARRRGDMIIGLTGEPLENRPEDIFHICAAIDPSVLGHPQIFDMTFIERNKYGKPIRYPNMPLLKKTLDAEIMVRVSREDVQEFLPTRELQQYVVPFDAPSLALYTTIVTDLVAALGDTQATSNFDLASHYGGAKASPAELAKRGKIMARLTCARMLCDHPMLLAMSADLYEASASGEMGAMKAGSAYALELKDRGLLDTLPKGRSPKMREVVSEIRAILAEDPANKVVVFSFFRPTLHWLEAALQRDAKAVVYHGGVAARRRDALKEQFNNDPETRLFLSSDAGGAGVDLPAGNYLINYDLPFSAGQLKQRNGRIDRMSSSHAHTVIQDFMMEGSIEEFYADIVEARSAAAKAAVDGKGRRSVSLPAVSLRVFLEKWLESQTTS